MSVPTATCRWHPRRALIVVVVGIDGHGLPPRWLLESCSRLSRKSFGLGYPAKDQPGGRARLAAEARLNEKPARRGAGGRNSSYRISPSK
jgi:hypothetical protein